MLRQLVDVTGQHRRDSPSLFIDLNGLPCRHEQSVSNQKSARWVLLLAVKGKSDMARDHGGFASPKRHVEHPYL
jgi:hypothetical protein